MDSHSIKLEWLSGSYAVCRLAPDADIPAWADARNTPFTSISRSNDELSIVARADVVPAEIRAERGWCALRVRGKLDFSLVGVLASLTRALAEAGVSVFAVSTYDTDYLLIRESDREHAAKVLGMK